MVFVLILITGASPRYSLDLNQAYRFRRTASIYEKGVEIKVLTGFIHIF
jgi:hypothetical protein